MSIELDGLGGGVHEHGGGAQPHPSPDWNQLVKAATATTTIARSATSETTSGSSQRGNARGGRCGLDMASG